MKRRDFMGMVTAGGAAVASAPLSGLAASPLGRSSYHRVQKGEQALKADVIIAGGGLGGCAAALAALRNGLSVILTEETDWIGGQLTQQGVPPDEHQWIESHGATQLYRDFRSAIRNYYKQHYPLTEEARARENLNPGDGSVSRLCHEPRVALAVLNNMFAPYISSGKCALLLEHQVKKAEVQGDRVQALHAVSKRSDKATVLTAPYFVDATELGDLLPLTGTEFVTGAEAKSDTRELHASETARPDNHQAFTVCFAMDYVPGSDQVIDKPREYNFWRNFVPEMTPPWPGRLLDLTYSSPSTLKPKALAFHPEGVSYGDTLNLWNYRRIINQHNFRPGFYPGDVTIVNWPQNDYVLGNLTGGEHNFHENFERGKQLSLSLFYWLQTEVPREDGKQGWPGLRLRGDLMGTEDGLAKYPYVRESRRIKAMFRILEEHVGRENRAMVSGKSPGNVSAADFYDSVGIGYYHIDLHPSSGGDNYIDFGSLPFQIPLGALLPQRMENLLPANKNIGTTHITNGCYRLHPVEWSIGEAAGLLVAQALRQKTLPRAIREQQDKLQDFQRFVRAQGIETHWPSS
nr:FAD-dependent oxidoreductase [Catalinimonas alkaloidigena]